MKTYEYIIPSHWLSAIINGDLTSFFPDEDSSKKACIAFLDEIANQNQWVVDYESESYFANYHDAWHLYPRAGDVIKITTMEGFFS